MTMTVDRPAATPTPGDAAEILREMAAVIRTVFGAGLQSSRAATAPVSGHAEAGAPPVVTATPPPPTAPTHQVPAASTAPATPASIPLPSLPLPQLPLDLADPADGAVPDLPQAHDQQAEPVERDDAPAASAYLGEVPTLRLVAPATDPAADVAAEHRHAVLREVAFLDD